MDEVFRGRPAVALRDRYGSFYEVRVGPLDPREVPDGLRDLVPYAEVWGVGDDVDRDGVVETAPSVAQQDLSAIFATRGAALDDWLAGDAASGPEFSREYVAFANMMIAYYTLPTTG